MSIEFKVLKMKMYFLDIKIQYFFFSEKIISFTKIFEVEEIAHWEFVIMHVCFNAKKIIDC
jgi:hypothetical protein